MASTSGLLDLTSLDWDWELLATLGLDRRAAARRSPTCRYGP